MYSVMLQAIRMLPHCEVIKTGLHRCIRLSECTNDMCIIADTISPCIKWSSHCTGRYIFGFTSSTSSFKDSAIVIISRDQRLQLANHLIMVETITDSSNI